MLDSPYVRADGRLSNQMRKIQITYDPFGYASSSILFQLGKTVVLCSVSIQNGVPLFLKGKKQGWLTSEYAMLPTATVTRATRDSSALKKNGRSIEISRLIGRSLRAIINLAKIGERTIVVDCDVLQADGSTRTASICGSYLALYTAVQKWIVAGLMSTQSIDEILTDTVAAVSVGIVKGQLLLDLDFSEDSVIDADYNFVLTKSNKIIEIQGAAEQSTITWQQFEKLSVLAFSGSEQIHVAFDESLLHVQALSHVQHAVENSV